MAMTAAADGRHALDLVPRLIEAPITTRLVWGRDDELHRLDGLTKSAQPHPLSARRGRAIGAPAVRLDAYRTMGFALPRRSWVGGRLSDHKPKIA